MIKGSYSKQLFSLFGYGDIRRVANDVTYFDLIQTGIFIVALISLCIRFLRESNSRQLFPVDDG